ncbi:unnamed protein product [Ilex paraguariensis]|uniref:Peptidase A1 domain-containing protein n=1 Tax=Ilex paraguariensis TaxID=185542 RepID=A0ABC8SSC5_9AQUA
MASSQIYTFSLFLLFLPSLTLSQKPSQINALVLPITKHALNLQYVTSISQRTPLVLIDLVVDLGSPFLWVSCDPSTYNSSSYRPTQCNSTQCSSYNPKPICSTNNTCILFSENAFTSKVSAGNLSEDVLSLQATDGLNPVSMVTLPNFLFSCAPDFLSQGLAKGAKGIAGLGWSPIGVPTQLARAFKLSRKFAICLPPSTNSSGVIFLGDGPYVLLPGIDISKILIYTPLVVNPRISASRTSHSEPLHSGEYHIGVKSIRVNGKKVPLNSSLLKIDKRGFGGTKISTVNPYTTLETSIYKSVTSMIIRETMAANVSRVAAVAPFNVCFSTRNNNVALTRPAMPVIDLMLQDDLVFWRIFETNSMVPMRDDIVCLGFLDGGMKPRTSIVIGAYQLEDNFLQFDLIRSRLGFTSSLLLRQTSCASFNFTSGV